MGIIWDFPHVPLMWSLCKHTERTKQQPLIISGRRDVASCFPCQVSSRPFVRHHMYAHPREPLLNLPQTFCMWQDFLLKHDIFSPHLRKPKLFLHSILLQTHELHKTKKKLLKKPAGPVLQDPNTSTGVTSRDHTKHHAHLDRITDVSSVSFKSNS